MAAAAASSFASIPVKLLHEGEGHKVTIELKNGEVYRGLLNDAEESMNCQLQNVTATARDGRVTKMECIYIRGSQIKYFILPDMLKNAPMFKKVAAMSQKKQQGGNENKKNNTRKKQRK